MDIGILKEIHDEKKMDEKRFSEKKKKTGSISSIAAFIGAAAGWVFFVAYLVFLLLESKLGGR